MRFIITTVALAVLLGGCAQGHRSLMMLTEHGQSRLDYEDTTSAYRACIAANPSGACEGQRALMQASANMIAAESSAILVGVQR